MAANTSPIFTNVTKNSWGIVTTADTTTDGTGANVVLVCTADATDGSYVKKIVFTPLSTSGSTTTSVAAARVYWNNGSTPGTASNNVLYKELSLPATAVNVSATTGVNSPELPLALQLQAGYRLYVGITAMAANTNWAVSVEFGDY
jgi:hypothetical protein